MKGTCKISSVLRFHKSELFTGFSQETVKNAFPHFSKWFETVFRRSPDVLWNDEWVDDVWWVRVLTCVLFQEHWFRSPTHSCDHWAVFLAQMCRLISPFFLWSCFCVARPKFRCCWLCAGTLNFGCKLYCTFMGNFHTKLEYFRFSPSTLHNVHRDQMTFIKQWIPNPRLLFLNSHSYKQKINSKRGLSSYDIGVDFNFVNAFRCLLYVWSSSPKMTEEITISDFPQRFMWFSFWLTVEFVVKQPEVKPRIVENRTQNGPTLFGAASCALWV